MPKKVRTERARRLRQAMTDAEIALWYRLRNRLLAGAKFRRQDPIAGFTVDFCCREHRLVIEADGSRHDESKRDERRRLELAKYGYRVIRFWNHDILNNQEAVLSSIVNALRASSPVAEHATASPKGRDDESKAEVGI